MNYLKTKEDERSFIKALCKQMNSDGVIAAREEAYIRAKSGSYGISPQIMEESLKEYRDGNVGEINFSCKEAAAQTCVDALDLTMIDFEFTQKEGVDLLALGEELGVPGSKEVNESLREYVVTDMAASGKFEKILLGIHDGTKPLDEAFPEKIDKTGFILCLAKVIAADGDFSMEENKFATSLCRTFGISGAIAMEAVAEFTRNKDIKPEFTNDYSKMLALREATRCACTDNELADSEKEVILSLAKELGGDITTETLDVLEEAVNERFVARQLREKALQKYIDEVSA